MTHRVGALLLNTWVILYTRKSYYLQGRQEIKIDFFILGFITWPFALIFTKMIFTYSSNISWLLIRNSEKAMATHSSTLAWKIPWREEPGGLQSMGSLKVGHDWVTSLSLFTSCIGEGNGNPLQCSCLENPRDWAWWAAVYGVAQSWTRLKQLSSRIRNYYWCWGPSLKVDWYLAAETNIHM